MKKLESCSEVKAKSWALLEEFAQDGYRVRLTADGCGVVSKPDGTAYTVEGFRCDCPDSQRRDGGSYTLPDGRRVCKHVLVISLARPCQWCGGTMVLEPAHRGDHYFRCLKCQGAFDARLVRQERQAARTAAAAAAA